MRHPRHGCPRKILQKVFVELAEEGIAVVNHSRIVASEPLGPSRRTYANAAAIAETVHAPAALLERLQQIEWRFARTRRGQIWSARTLDLDIVLWSEGIFFAPALVIPHPSFRERRFVLGPAAEIAPSWIDPATGLTLAQLHARLTRPRPLPRARRWSGP